MAHVSWVCKPSEGRHLRATDGFGGVDKSVSFPSRICYYGLDFRSMTSQGRPAALEEYYARTVKNYETPCFPWVLTIGKTSMLRAKACQPSRWHPRATWLSTGKICVFWDGFNICIVNRKVWGHQIPIRYNNLIIIYHHHLT